MQRAGLDTALCDLVELHYTDAPNEASGPVPPDVSPHFPGPYYEWWNAHQDEEGRWRYDGWERALAHLEAVAAEHGPFDGVVGFSQGGVALLVGMQRAGFALKSQPPLRFCVCFAGIRCVAGRGPAAQLGGRPNYEGPAAAGSLSVVITIMVLTAAPSSRTHPRGRDPKLEPFYAALRGVPSVHIIGDRDPVKRLKPVDRNL